MKKYRTVLLIVFSILCLLLMSCQDDTPIVIAADSGTTIIETEIVEEVSDNLPTFDFDKREIRILSGLHGTYPVSTFSVEEQTGDLLDDILYERNIKIEERFNVVFNEIVMKDIFNVNDQIKNTTYAGEDAYDIAMMIDRYALRAGMDGQLLSYDKLPYIDLDKPYWNKNVAEDFSIADKLFFTYGDDNLVYFGSTTMLVFNKNMLNDYSLDDPYQLVKEGKWTYNKYFEMGRAVVDDLNGDGVFDVEDQYGAVICTNMHYANFWLQDGLKLVDKDSDDLPYFNVPGNDKLFSIFNEIFEKSNADNFSYDLYKRSDWKQSYTTSSEYNSAMMMFTAGKSLFASASLITIMETRAMEEDFGIIPYPKSNETSVCISSS